MKQPTNQSISELKILSSQFKAKLIPISRKEEFQKIYDAFKKEFPKADHYPYAYIIDNYSKCSDYGEPSGSAGRPILELLNQHELNHALIIIARYFGGRKLGVQRLRKSFAEVASNAINNATLAIESKVGIYEITLANNLVSYLKGKLLELGGDIIEVIYKENEATLKAFCPLNIDFDFLLPPAYKGQATLLGNQIRLTKDFTN